ncbi:hypothetical protein QYF61_011895 [Mycteria americana]|uniref:Uncharacterized protein n=1 Tax=Mycteria americana TaxID=33587 RepID=A0AAN7NFT1_MYCAM|nr:hypothetical protein QYF61_011895 [Mycteria americana]
MSLFSVRKRRLRGIILMGGPREDRNKLFSEVHTERTRCNEKILHHEGDQMLAEVPKSGYGISVLGDTQNLPGHFNVTRELIIFHTLSIPSVKGVPVIMGLRKTVAMSCKFRYFMYKTDSADVTPLLKRSSSGGFASELHGSREIKLVAAEITPLTPPEKDFCPARSSSWSSSLHDLMAVSSGTERGQLIGVVSGLQG